MAWGINKLSENIERIQKRAFRIILPDVDYIEALNYLTIQTMRERREKHCVDLIVSMSDPSTVFTIYFRNALGKLDKGKLSQMSICIITLNLEQKDLRMVH